MSYPTIHKARHHFGWNNAFEPVLRVAPGDTVVFEVVDASGGQLSKTSTTKDVAALDFARVNPVTGPVYVEGAQPGDALVVDIVDFEGSGWGWTAIIPGFGLLAEDFPTPFLHISSYGAGGVEFAPGIRLPVRPFPGTIGVAPAEPGLHSVVPPREVGGNMDIRDLTRGDGEVCGTAVESPMAVTLKFTLQKRANLRRPQFAIPSAPTRHVDERGYYATTGIGPDLMQAARDAVRDAIDYVGKEYRLAPDLAYALCSVAADLRISEVVDVPNWVVSAYLPKAIFS